MPEVVFTRRPVASRCATRRSPGTTGGTRMSLRPPWCGPGRVPGRMPGLDRRPDRQQRLGQRRARRRPDPCAHAERPDRRRGRRARRPARRRHPRPRAGPAPQQFGDAPGQGWGYTGVFAKANGGGFLTDYFPDAYKAIWDFHGQVATSRHLPGVRYTGITHPGLFGTAPSAELLARWNRRERALIDTDPDRVPPLALPPLEDNTLGGTATGDVAERHRPRRGPHGARPGERRQPRHQELHPRLAGLLPGAREGREALGRRPALQPGRRRDHLLRRDRDGRLHRLPRRPDQGRHGEVRGHHQPDLHAGQRRAAVLGVPDVHRASRSTTTRTRTTTSTRRWPTAGPASTPSSTSRSSATRASRPTCCSARRRSRAGSAGSSTFPTPAARSTCPRRSSTST